MGSNQILAQLEGEAKYLSDDISDAEKIFSELANNIDRIYAAVVLNIVSIAFGRVLHLDLDMVDPHSSQSYRPSA